MPLYNYELSIDTIIAPEDETNPERCCQGSKRIFSELCIVCCNGIAEGVEHFGFPMWTMWKLQRDLCPGSAYIEYCYLSRPVQ